jgi:hypothetical protein
MNLFLHKNGVFTVFVNTECSTPLKKLCNYQLRYNCQLMKQGGAGQLNRLSQEGGGQANFAKNLRTSPFKKDLSNGIIFRQSIYIWTVPLKV